ncbi:MAG: hypothetical protein M1829_005697 [Trizodia sp. TS-e1964]|nr:MAG: hypothetical protein M1829_005697 [Trizodia sp. TS-e1964]
MNQPNTSLTAIDIENIDLSAHPYFVNQGRSPTFVMNGARHIPFSTVAVAEGSLIQSASTPEIGRDGLQLAVKIPRSVTQPSLRNNPHPKYPAASLATFIYPMTHIQEPPKAKIHEHNPSGIDNYKSFVSIINNVVRSPRKDGSSARSRLPKTFRIYDQNSGSVPELPVPASSFEVQVFNSRDRHKLDIDQPQRSYIESVSSRDSVHSSILDRQNTPKRARTQDSSSPPSTSKVVVESEVKASNSGNHTIIPNSTLKGYHSKANGEQEPLVLSKAAQKSAQLKPDLENNLGGRSPSLKDQGDDVFSSNNQSIQIWSPSDVGSSLPKQSPPPYRKLAQSISSIVPLDQRENALRNVSGNKQTPPRSLPRDTREMNVSPDSARFNWHPKQKPNTRLPSALKKPGARSKGHKRQNCVRISTQSPLPVARRPLKSTVEEVGKEEEFARAWHEIPDSSVMSDYSASNYDSHRPPTSPTFNPRLNSLSPYMSVKEHHDLIAEGSQYSPTLSVVNYYSNDSLSGQAMRVHPFGPDRPNLDHPSPGHLTLDRSTSPSSMVSSPSPSRSTSFQGPRSSTSLYPIFGPRTPTEYQKSRPPHSYKTPHPTTPQIFRFPLPPTSPEQQESSPSPRHPILNGPRAPPPTRTRTLHHPRDSVYQSIIALRRMNSEASSTLGPNPARSPSLSSIDPRLLTPSVSGSALGRKRYRSLGQEPLNFVAPTSPTSPRRGSAFGISTGGTPGSERGWELGVRDSRNFQMPSPVAGTPTKRGWSKGHARRASSLVGGITEEEWGDEVYDQQGFLRSASMRAGGFSGPGPNTTMGLAMRGFF